MCLSETPLTGTLELNGAEIAKSTYGDLTTYLAPLVTAGVLEETNGAGGAGSTHVRLPDARGRFPRAWDNSAGVDPEAATRTGGDLPGSTQAEELKSHSHYQRGGIFAAVTGGSDNFLGTQWVETIMATTATGGAETRPENMAFSFCVKY
jgi:microcystin-dependent protein